MLNYNTNYIDPLQQEKKGNDFRPHIIWNFEAKSVATGSPNLYPSSFATMSISAPATNCINVTRTQSDSFFTDTNYMVTASVSGINWAITGSTTMSLYIAGTPINSFDPYYSYFASVSASALAGNITSISGSILQNSFTGSDFYNFFVSGSVVHAKGNPFNTSINWETIVSGIVPINGQNTNNAAALSINTDTNLVIGPIDITGSNEITSGSTTNDYSFSITASLSGSSNWYDDAYYVWTTKSLAIPELGIDYRDNVTSSIITASFNVNTTTPYNVVASILNTRVATPVTASFLLMGAGGGGAAGGLNIGPGGGGGGAGEFITGSFPIMPNYNYTVSLGGGGSAGVNTAGQGNGGRGGNSTFVYYVGPNYSNGTSTIVAHGGYGGNVNGNGGLGGGGTSLGLGGNAISGSVGYTVGKPYLGGGGGNWVGPGFSSNGDNTQPPGFYITGNAGGEGGYIDNNTNTDVAPTSAIGYGGGGGGAAASNSTNKPGGSGGAGMMAISYVGTPILTLSGPSGSYSTQQISGSTYHYLYPGSSFKWNIS